MDTPRDIAKRKARYSAHDWLLWRDRAGEQHIARCTSDSVKAAMLAVGTQGHFTLYEARTGRSYAWGWYVANNLRVNMLRQEGRPALGLRKYRQVAAND